MKKLIWLFGIILLVGVVGLYAKFKQTTDQIFTPEISRAEMGNSLVERFDDNEAINILLLGYAGGRHDGAYLTDSIVLVHVEPGASRVALISIPRDIWVKIPTSVKNETFWKINAAYELGLDDKGYPNKQEMFKGRNGGGNMAKYVVGKVTGLTVDRFVALDFKGFKNTIDVLGGVDVALDNPLDDFEYPIEGKEDDLCGQEVSKLPDLEKIATRSATEAFPCRYKHLHFGSGVSHLDGVAALEFVRSRHSLFGGNDFGRSHRQKSLMVAVKQKVMSIGFIPKILAFADSLTDDLRSDFSLEELKFLLDRAEKLSKFEVKNVALSDQNVLKNAVSEDGQSVLEPRGGVEEWEGVHSYLTNLINPVVGAVTIKIENASNVGGLGVLAANRLQDKDLNVLAPTNFSGGTRQESSILINDRVDQGLIEDLKKEFGVGQVEKGGTGSLDYDVLVVVGKDYNLKQGKKLIN